MRKKEFVDQSKELVPTSFGPEETETVAMKHKMNA